MRTIDPKIAARITPSMPAFRPMVFEMNAEGRKVTRKPIAQMVSSTRRAMELKNFHETLRDFAVLYLFFKKERKSRPAAKIQTIRLNISSAPDLDGRRFLRT
jgi:hypothetical protein